MAFNKEKVMDAARKFVDKGQIDKAVKEYLRIVHEDPKDVRVWLKIGDLHVKRGSKQDATEVYLKVARVYDEQGFSEKAIAVFKQVLKIDPHLVDVNLKLAELYRQRGMLADAMQHFEAVAGHFHREGNTKEALATVRQLVELDPENVATRIKLAELSLVRELASSGESVVYEAIYAGVSDAFVAVKMPLMDSGACMRRCKCARTSARLCVSVCLNRAPLCCRGGVGAQASWRTRTWRTLSGRGTCSRPSRPTPTW